MTGKMCDGIATNNFKKLNVVKAYGEGVRYRQSGAALAVPITDNPFPDPSPERTSWDQGWNDANLEDGTGSHIEPCVAEFRTIAPL